MILKRRNQVKEKYTFEIFLSLIIIGIFVWQGIKLVTILISIFFGLIIYWLLSHKFYAKKHNKKMTSKLLRNK